MNPHHHRARRTAALLLAAAALLAPVAPARQTTRRAADAPAKTPAQTGVLAPQAKPAPPAKNDGAARPAAVTAAAAESKPAPSSDVSIDNLFAADAYGVYGEMRMVGQHVSSADFKQLLDPLRSPGGLPGELRQLLDFITEHADELTAARVAVGAMPVKPGLPTAVVAVELTSAEEARKLVPQLRTTLAKYAAGSQDEGEPDGARDTRRGARRRGGGRAPQKRQAGAEGQAIAVSEAVEQAASPFQIRRSGRVVALGDVAFTFKSLRGAPAAMPLTGEPGFQAVRARFASDTLFLYFNTTRMSGAARRQAEESERKYKEFEERQLRDEAARVSRRGGTPAPRAVAGGGRVAVTTSDKTADANAPQPTPVVISIPDETEDAATTAAVKAEMEKQMAAHEEALQKRTPEEIAKQQEEETRREFENQLGRMIFSAGPGGDGGTWPESIGVGASFEGDAVVVRAFLLSESEDAPLRPIPFVPILHAGPPITSEAANVLPADTDVLVSASLDLTQMYDYVASMFKLFDMAVSSPDKQGIFDSQVSSFESQYKFRIKEDLIKALGNEIAVALPAEMFGVRARPAPRDEGPKDAPPGATLAPAAPAPPPQRSAPDAPVVVISLNDKRAMQELLPRALEAAGIKGLNAQQLLEKRGQAELVTFSQGSVAFIDRFLVVAFDPAAMNHIVESYNAGATLSAADDYRDPTSWQPKQGLGHVYVSNALTKGMIGDVRKDVDLLDDETLRNLVTRLDPNPGAVTLAATKDGGLMYELHVPKNLLSLWSISGMIAQQLAPMRSHEAMAGYELRRIASMQSDFKEKQGRYATLAELKSEMDSESDDDGPGRPASYEARVEGYEIKISAHGDRFEATATPTGYPKQGRRSFYMDHTGVLRGADTGGRPATATTEPAVR